MKKIISPFLGIVMLGLTNCIDPGGDNITSYSTVPAIVEEFDIATFQPALFTSLGKVIAPELQKALTSELYDGAAVLANFEINADHQPSTEYTIASNVQWIKIDQVRAYSTNGGESMSGTFDVKIERINDVVLVFCEYNTFIFIVFAHEAPADQKFIYEMTYDASENTDIVYIRAKNNGQGTKANTTFTCLYAFDITDYLMALRQGEKRVTFKLKYKTGEEEGKDVYREYDQPIVLIYEE